MINFSLKQTFTNQILITDPLMKQFAELSQDYSPIHIENDFAQSKGLKGRVAYGNILGLMVSRLVGMDLKTSDIMLISQTIKYHAPVFIDDTITLLAEIDAISDAVQVIELKLTFTNQTSEKIASGKCQAKFI
jgi:3-hydroxybutyryl-CoA dehydratase